MNHKGNLLSFSLYHLFHHLFKSADTPFPELHRIFSSRKCLCTSRINPALILWIPSQLLIILPLKKAKITFPHLLTDNLLCSRKKNLCRLPAPPERTDNHKLRLPLLTSIFFFFQSMLQNELCLYFFICHPNIPLLQIPFRRKMPNQLDFHLLYISSSFLCFSFDSLHNQSPN